MKQRLNSSHLEIAGEKEVKKEVASLMNACCSWGTLSNCFLVVACSGGKCDVVVEVLIVMGVLLLLLG